MYKFIDVTETPEGTLLPSEALKINGTYIEDLIPGYRTLTVEGREALSPEISSYGMGFRDGSLMSGKRYPARTIRVTYQLICGSNEDFRAAFNKLGAILDVKDAELIFDDEPDKYFTGTPSRIGEVPPGRNSIVGEFDILCLDPFKYSVTEFEAAATPGDPSIFIDYNGTYKSYPTLRAEFHEENEASEDGESVVELTGNGECGYVAFFNEREKIVQLGNPDEIDGEEGAYPESQTLINAKFDKSNAWGSAAKSQWSVNGGLLTSSEYSQSGAIAIGEATTAVSGTPATAGTPSGEIARKRVLTATSDMDHPYFHYTIDVIVSNRKASSVDLTVLINTRLDNKASYFGRGLLLEGYFSIGDQRKSCMLHTYNDYWSGTTVHGKSLNFTLSIPQEATELPKMTFRTMRVDKTGGIAGMLATTSCQTFIIPAYVAPTAATAGRPATYYLAATNYGSGNGWHGATITRSIPGDAAGDKGAANFELSFASKISIGAGSSATKQKGAFQAIVTSGSGESRAVLAGLNVCKSGNGKVANLQFYVGGDIKETAEINIANGNKYFNQSTSIKITKQGKRVTFAIGSAISKTYIDEAISDVVASEVTFAFLKYGTVAPLTYNGLYWAQFVKNYCETWKDIPNKFKANDIVEADCRTGEITHNGASARSLGALGNDFEGFYLSPGLNQIGTSFSDWVDEGFEPTFKVKYREVYL